MQDVGYWEKHGVRSVAVTTTAFLRQANQQLHDLGLNGGVCYACVPHPVQGLSKSEVEERLSGVVADVLRALQEDGYESPSPPAAKFGAEANAAVEVGECGS